MLEVIKRKNFVLGDYVEQFEILDFWNNLRAYNAEIYRVELTGVSETKLPIKRAEGEHVYHLFVIRAQNRDALGKHLEEKQIQAGLHYPIPIHRQRCFQENEK